MRLSRLVPALAAALPVFALSLGFGPSAAAAQSSAVVLEFEGGRDGAQARRAVVAGLEGAFPLVPLGDVEEAARTSGLDLTSPADAGRAAESAGAALVLSGAVTGRGRRARTTIVVRDVGGRDLAVREAGPPFGRPAQRALGEEALALVREAEMALAPSRSARGSEPGGNDDDAAPGAEGGTDDVDRVAGDTDTDATTTTTTTTTRTRRARCPSSARSWAWTRARAAQESTRRTAAPAATTRASTRS